MTKKYGLFHVTAFPGDVGPQEVKRVATGRSAITGRFVKQSTVKSNPKQTVNHDYGKGKGGKKK